MTGQPFHSCVPRLKPLRIAVFAPFPPILGGMAELAKLVSDGLEGDGHKVRRVDLGTGWSGVWFLPLLYLRMFRAAASSDIVQIISASGAAFWGKDLPGVLVARLLRKTVIIDFVGGAAVDSAPNWGWWRRLPFRLAHRVVIPTELFRKALEMAHLRANLVVIPHVVEIDPFLAVPEVPGENKPVLLAAKGLFHHAGVDFLIKALPLVRRRFPDCELWIAGDGPVRSSLEAQARTEAPNAVRFLGPVSHEKMPELMARATLFVHGARCESFGLVLVEAMAAARPVVAFAVGGIPEVVADGRTGFLVPLGSIEAFAERVVSLLADPIQRAAMAEAARAWSRRFAWAEIRGHWHALHNSSTSTGASY